MKEVHGTDPATAQSLSAHLQTLKERVGGCIVGGKAGTNQEIVVPKPTIINGLDGNQFQIVMNGEPLQIIPVDSHETQIDGEGRHIITNDGQQLEVKSLPLSRKFTLILGDFTRSSIRRTRPSYSQNGSRCQNSLRK